MRKRFMFWLDLSKADEQALTTDINDLKQARTYTRTIREGIQLICDLRAGKLDLLYKLFPWVWDQIALEIQARQLEAIPTQQPARDAIQVQLERLEKLLLQQGSVPLEMRPAPSIPGEIELEIKQAGTDENNNSTWNFMIASSLQVYETCEGLPPNIIDYGLRTGRIPPDKAGKKVEQGSPKKMDVPQFAAPDFDDDHDLSLVNI